MKIKFIKPTLSVILCISILLCNSHALANDSNFWYKGANFNEHLTISGQKTRMTDSKGNPLSAVVVTASTEYDGRSGGQEMIRAFTRDSIVKNYFNANAAKAVEIDLKFTNQQNRRGFITKMTPKESTTWTSIGIIEYYLKGYYALAYHTAIALANGLTAGVKHFEDTYGTTGEIVFYNSTINNVELPSTVSYRDAHNYYDGTIDSRTGNKIKNGTTRGVVGYFNFYYNLAPGQTGSLEASARAWYDIQITNNGWPAIYSTYTDYATVVHDINGR